MRIEDRKQETGETEIAAREESVEPQPKKNAFNFAVCDAEVENGEREEEEKRMYGVQTRVVT